jgi:hypothetical protein
MAGVAVVLVLVLGGTLAGVLLDGDDGDPAAGSIGATGAGGTATEQVAGTSSAPSAEEMVAFAENYVRTADADPASGFAMLTPSYQRTSKDYEDFWGAVQDPQILEIVADPSEMTVTYTYRYTLPRVGSRTETVTLALVHDGDRMLIDAAR